MLDIIKGDTCKSLLSECDTIFEISYVADTACIDLVNAYKTQLKQMEGQRKSDATYSQRITSENKHVKKQRNFWMGTSGLLLLILIIL